MSHDREREWMAGLRADSLTDMRADYRRDAESEDGFWPPEDIVLLREGLGLSQSELARALGVEDRAVRRWEAGERKPLGKHVWGFLHLRDEHERLVDEAVEALGRLTPRERVFLAYRTEAALRAALPDSPYPASFIRSVAREVARQVEGVRVVFAPES